MPIFEYQCQECGIRFERLQRKGDPFLTTCPECGGPVRRLLQPPGIIFKGSGFYITDHRRSGNAGTDRSRKNGRKDSAEKPEKSAAGHKDKE